MKHLISILLFCSCLSISCRKEKGFVGIGNPTFIWNTEVSGLLPMQPVLYKNKIYFSATQDGLASTKLVGLDKNDGHKLTETVTTPLVNTFTNRYYQYENALLFVNNQGIHYFDLETAAFKWTLVEPICCFKGIDSLLFGVRNNELLKINLQNKTVESIQKINSAATFWNATPYFDVYKKDNGELCLATVAFKDSQNVVLQIKNLNTNMIITSYEVPKKGLDGGFTPFFKVFQDKIYYGDCMYLFCRDLISGQLIWSKDYSANGNAIGTTAFWGAHELFIAPFGSQNLIGLDLKTGSKLWSVDNNVDLVGFSSMEDFYYFNKTLYWGSRNLNAIDGATGRIIWSFNAEFAKPSFLFSGLPRGEGDKLYISSGSKALCIKAAQ